MRTFFSQHALVPFLRLLMNSYGKHRLVPMKIIKKSSACEEHQFCPEIRMVYGATRELCYDLMFTDYYSKT